MDPKKLYEKAGKCINTLADLQQAAVQGRAVICPGFALKDKPIPAKMVYYMQAECVHRMIGAGLFIYKTPVKGSKKFPKLRRSVL